MPAERPSHGFAIHTRREKAANRREQQPLVTIPSWATVSGMIELRTNNSLELNILFEINRVIVKEFYDARYAKITGKGDKKLNKFIRKYDTNEKSKYYDPDLIEELAPIFTIVRDSFPSNLRTRR